MADVETLQYNIDSQAQLQAMERAIDTFNEMGQEYDDLADELKDVSKEADKAEGELDDLSKTGGRLKGAFRGLGGLIGGGLGALAGLAAGAISSTREWALGVEDLSNKFAIGLDNATALATSWRLAGVEAETGESAILSFQGRLIDELEAQKEAAKEVQAIQRERTETLGEMAEAETEHLQTLADLEEERGEISSAGTAKRRAQQQQELSDLSKDYNRFLEEQKAAEEKENQDFEEIWEERARIFEQKSEQLRTDLSEKSRSARNVRDFLAAQDEFSKKQKLLSDDLSDEKDKNQSAHEERISNLQSATDREKELFAERSAAVNAAADQDVAKVQAANAKAVADMDERVAAEKAAFEDRTAGFNEQLDSLSEAEAAAQDAGAGLQFVMQELGVQLTDAEGNIRPVDELMWDMKEALNGMEDGAKKAAIISDLGWEDLATWIEDGADATDAMAFAQENNLVVTEDYLETIKEQNRLIAEMQLKLQGAAMEFASSEIVINAMAKSLEWVSDALDIAIGLWDQATKILNLLWEKGKDEGWFDGLIAAFETVTGWVEDAGESLGMLFKIFSTEGGAGELGKNLLGALPGFETGIRSVEGVEPQLAVVHPGEEIRTRSEVLSDSTAERGGETRAIPQVLSDAGETRATSRVPSDAGETRTNEQVLSDADGKADRGSINININAPIYGVADLQGAIMGAIDQYDRGRAGAGV